MKTISSKLKHISGLWPVALGMSLSWLATGLWWTPAIHKTEALASAQSSSGKTTVLDAILEKNILLLENPKPQAATTGPDPSSWKLLGIFAGTRPMALLLIEAKTKTLKVGEVEGGWTLDSVQNNAAVFKQGSVEKMLSIFKETAPASLSKGSKNKIGLAKAEIAPVLSDPGNLLQQALFKPSLDGAKTVGYRIDNIQENSILKKLGFVNGDVLMRINGEAIDGPAKMMQLYSGLQSAQAVNMDIKRGSDLISLVVELN